MADGSVDTTSLLGKIAGYTEILSKDPHSTVFVPLSEAYRTMGMLDDAIEIARRGIVAVPGYAPGFITLGRSLAEKGRLHDAAEAFARALQLEDANLQAIKGLARVRLLLGQADQARPLLVKARQLAPTDAAVARMLADLPPAGPPPAATPAAGKSDVPIATVTVAEIYERQGLLRKAYKVYHDLYRTDPGNQQLRQKLLELRQRIESGSEPSPAPATETSPPSLATGPAAQPADASPPPPTAAPAPVPQQQLAATYQRWLETIQARRHHVR